MTLSIAAETAYGDIERDWIENEPPGLFPGDQSSYWGQVRKVFADYLQILADQLAQWYDNLDPAFCDDIDMHNWEAELGIPNQDGIKALQDRRNSVVARLEKGAFTRTRRRKIVENFIIATFGDPLSLTPDGLPLTAPGLSLFGETLSLAGTYAIVEDIPNFTYTVRIKNTNTPDIDALTRELLWITPAGISFTIIEVATP